MRVSVITEKVVHGELRTIDNAAAAHDIKGRVILFDL